MLSSFVTMINGLKLWQCIEELYFKVRPRKDALFLNNTPINKGLYSTTFIIRAEKFRKNLSN
jgi:hypothetical protein